MPQRRTFYSAAGLRLIRPAGVPRRATFVLDGRNAWSVFGHFASPDGIVRASWSQDGALQLVHHFDALGVRNGLECSFLEDGAIEWQVPWVDGQMHGLARQYDAAGRQLFRTRFVRGAGLDVWVNGRDVAELREYVQSRPHGVERWGHPRLPYEECHFLHGRRAGIHRLWVGASLAPGYPRYVIDDDVVSRDEYLRARRTRPELAPDRRADDVRARPLHPALLAMWMRKDLRARVLRMPGPEELIGCGAPSPD